MAGQSCTAHKLFFVVAVAADLEPEAVPLCGDPATGTVVMRVREPGGVSTFVFSVCPAHKASAKTSSYYVRPT
jgi:hypothetical protein